MRNYLRLLQFLKGHRPKFSLAVITMLFASFFEGFQITLLVPVADRIFTNQKIQVPNKLPEFLANIVDNLNNMDPHAMFVAAPFFVLGVIFTKQFLVFFYQYLMSDVSQSISKDVRDKLYAHIQNFSLDYFSKKRTGELVSRITYDVPVIENAVSYAVVDLFRQTFMILFYVAVAFLIYPKAALVIFVVFPFIAFPLSKIGKRLRKLSKDTQEKMANINSHLLETFSGIKLIKAFNTEEYEIDRFKKKNHDIYKLRMKSIKRILSIAPLTEVFGGICGVTIFVIIGKIIMNGELSFGVFVLFFGSILSIISPVKKLGNVNALIQQALAANQRIYDVLDRSPTVVEKDNADELHVMKISAQLKDVTFRYTEEDETILRKINLEIRKGEIVAIVGPTGVGKTTLVNLLPRLYDPSEGVVKIDGKNVRDVTFASLRKQFGIVSQETILFNDTVKANIAYGNRTATQEEIENAAKSAFAHRFIIKMPEGYDTVIGDRGFRLSGGEKQRISIARAILRNPPILILDEATSQLDSESEKFVQEALDKLMFGRTVVAIAHRLSTIKKANKIVVLDKGSIVGEGPHDELLKTCPLYKKLYNMQFQV